MKTANVARCSGTDGPFAESKELVMGYWPPALTARPPTGEGRYAPVNGLDMYYEVHGSGRPLVLLHGGMTTIDLAFGDLVRTLAYGRQVIAIEQQAHGHTADIDRTLSYERMADDTAELLRQLGVERADFFGFSMGAATTLQVALRHPRLVRKQAIVSGGYCNDGYNPGVVDRLIRVRDPVGDGWVPESLQQGFERVATGPSQWHAAMTRMKEVIQGTREVGLDSLRAVDAHTLFVGGETGMVRRDHLEEMSRLVPRAHIKVFRGDDHDPAIIGRAAALLPAFLETPVPRRRGDGPSFVNAARLASQPWPGVVPRHDGRRRHASSHPCGVQD